MSALESTVSMLEVMPVAEVQAVFEITKAIFEQRQESPFQPLTKEQILEDLEISSKEIEEGKFMEMSNAIQALRSRYGL